MAVSFTTAGSPSIVWADTRNLGVETSDYTLTCQRYYHALP
ncbi:MAG: hypothetical protein ACRD2P_05385 [Terriglobia bacterium]